MSCMIFDNHFSWLNILLIVILKQIQTIKIKILEMIDVKILGHIAKYKPPSSIQGLPTWHKSQLQDLLIMAKEFGMFHFFLI